MKNNTTAIRLLIEDLSASDIEVLYKWIGKLLPKQVEAETPAMDVAALWWLAKLKSGDVLPDVGWPKDLPVNDLVEDYVNVIKRDITYRGNSTAMGRFLKKVGAVGKTKLSSNTEVTIRAGEPGGEGLRPGGEVTRTLRRRHYALYRLDACRAGFEAVHGRQDWADSDDSSGSSNDGHKIDSQIPRRRVRANLAESAQKEIRDTQRDFGISCELCI